MVVLQVATLFLPQISRFIHWHAFVSMCSRCSTTSRCWLRITRSTQALSQMSLQSAFGYDGCSFGTSKKKEKKSMMLSLCLLLHSRALLASRFSLHSQPAFQSGFTSSFIGGKSPVGLNLVSHNNLMRRLFFSF